MAKNTTLKTRIQNRHDTEANWTTASNATNPFIPLKGEVIVYDPDTTHTTPRAKIGDGVTKVGNLAFVGGDISKYVTLDTAQTISGSKLFLDPIQVGGSSNLEDYTKITSTDITVRAGENASWYKVGNDKFSHGDTTNTYTAILPNKSGTVALLSDIPTPPTNYVTLDTTQVITGDKTFNGSVVMKGVVFKAGPETLSIKYSDGWAIEGETIVSGVPYPGTIYFPDGNGTLALTSDIPTNYVTTDTEQTISGNKTFSKAVSVSTDGDAGFEITGGGNAWKINARTEEGPLNIVGQGAAGANTYQFPNKSGTIALTSDISTLDSAILTGLMTGSNGVTVADKDSKVDISFTNSPTFYNQTEEEGYVGINEAYMGLGPQLRVCANTGADYTIMSPDRYSIYVGDMEASIYGVYDNTDNSTYLYINSTGTSLGRILTTKDLDTAPIKVKDTFVASSWSTSSATTDTQFGKYYKDVTIPNKNIINVRCVSTKGMSGITLDYAPEIKCNNRRTSDTNLRIYSNSQLEGAITITLVGDILPNKFSKTNATLSASSWTTSSATVDTQFAKYYTDITVPAGDVMNIRILSNEDITGISTAAYYPEVWSDNRKINSTTLRVYSNKQVAGSVIILTEV